MSKFKLSEIHERLPNYSPSDKVTLYKVLASGLLTKGNGSTEQLSKIELRSGKEATITGLQVGQEMNVEDVGQQGNNRVIKILPKNQQEGAQGGGGGGYSGKGGGGGGRPYDSRGQSIGNALNNAILWMCRPTMDPELAKKATSDDVLKVADKFLEWSFSHQQIIDQPAPAATQKAAPKTATPAFEKIDEYLRKFEPFGILLEDLEHYTGVKHPAWSKAEFDVMDWAHSRLVKEPKGEFLNQFTGWRKKE